MKYKTIAKLPDWALNILDQDKYKYLQENATECYDILHLMRDLLNKAAEEESK